MGSTYRFTVEYSDRTTKVYTNFFENDTQRLEYLDQLDSGNFITGWISERVPNTPSTKVPLDNQNEDVYAIFNVTQNVWHGGGTTFRPRNTLVGAKLYKNEKLALGTARNLLKTLNEPEELTVLALGVSLRKTIKVLAWD